MKRIISEGLLSQKFCNRNVCDKEGREPWSSGKGKRLTFRRSWVRIPAPYTGWTFFTYCKNCNVCLKRPKINEKEAGVGPFLKKEGFKASGGSFHLNGAAVIWQAQGQLCARFHLESNTHIYLCN